MGKSNIKSNTVYNIIKCISAIVFPLISFPYASRVLLTESIGKVNFSNSVVSYFALIASPGISTYAIRECAKDRGDREKLDQTASQLFSINVVTTLIAYVALALTLLFARSLDNYRMLIVIQSTSILFTTLGADWINSAMEDFKFITIRTVAVQVLSLVLMFSLVHSPDDYLIYALISVVSSSGANVVNVFYRRRFCRIRLTRNMHLKRHIPTILMMFSMILAQTIYCNSDITMIGLFWGDHEVGLYSTAVKIYNIVNTIVASVATVLMPQLSHSFLEKNYTEINRLLRYGLGFIVVLGMPCVVGLNAVAEGIVELMAGSEYAGAVPALRVLTISLAASFASGFQSNLILIPSGKEKVCLKAAVVSAVLNVVLNLIFIPKFGVVAAAATTATAELVGFIIKMPYIDKRIDLGSMKDMLLAPAWGCVGIVIISFLMNVLVEGLILRTILTIVLSILVYLAVLVYMRHDFTLSLLRREKK